MKGVLRGGPADGHLLAHIPEGCKSINTPTPDGVARYVLAGTHGEDLRFDFDRFTPWSTG